MAGTEPLSANKTEEGDTPHVQFEKLCDVMTSALGDWSRGGRRDGRLSKEAKIGEGPDSGVSDKKGNGFIGFNFDEDMLAALRVLSMGKQVLFKAVEAWNEEQGTREDDKLRARDFVKRICSNASASSRDRPAMELLKSCLEERISDMKRGTGTEGDDADILCNLLRQSDAEPQSFRGQEECGEMMHTERLSNREPLERAEQVGMPSEQKLSMNLAVGPSSNVRRNVLHPCIVYRKMQKHLARRFLEAVEAILATKY
eukprot:TRINITY_DN7632_c0_g2_i1.p1 TRINITY_DN7632_c0_g2~~TRINITY_DN7632_c0_g2_i1.p1  ORF type:complete len:268 (+),score=50.58 TRINITY_DN7632_c0_g2_i1:36-806(+)